MHATIPKGCVGGFEFTVFQRNLNHARETTDVCVRVLKKSNKSRFDSYSVKKKTSVLIISHITFRDCRAHIFFRWPFSKQMYTSIEVVCTCMIFNHILIFTIKSNSFKKAIRRGYFYPGYHTFFLACGDWVRRCFGIGYRSITILRPRAEATSGSLFKVTKIKTCSWKDSGTQQGVPSP